MLKSTSLKLAAAAVLMASAGLTAQAQDAGALVDALVKKGILNDQEAEQIRADMTRDFATTPAGKLNISNSITELKLYGDLRLRYQYDNKDSQVDPFPVGVHQDRGEKDRSPSGNQRDRYRFRLRLNADFRLTEGFYGGVELQTAQNSDSGNQTFQDGFNDYGIFISRAYIGWAPNDWLDVKAGKIPNPFYATDLTWDPDINPTGLAQSFAFHKMRFGGIDAGQSGMSKDGKSMPPSAPVVSDTPWELTLVAGQFIYDDNAEGSGIDGDLNTDAYLFETQLIASYKFGNGVKVTLAPAWFVETAGSLSGFDNENSFVDSANVSGASRDLNILLFPGDISFKVAGIKTKVLWDFAYNFEGRKRVENIYRLTSPAGVGDNGVTDPDDVRKGHSNVDDYAFLAGFQLGENKKKGDWSALANYRQTGLGALDPNLNDSDFALSELNTRGFKVGVAYNFTDFCIGAVTYMHAWNLRQVLPGGGEATGGQGVADSNSVDVLQVDLNLKF